MVVDHPITDLTSGSILFMFSFFRDVWHFTLTLSLTIYFIIFCFNLITDRSFSQNLFLKIVKILQLMRDFQWLESSSGILLYHYQSKPNQNRGLNTLFSIQSVTKSELYLISFYTGFQTLQSNNKRLHVF